MTENGLHHGRSDSSHDQFTLIPRPSTSGDLIDDVVDSDVVRGLREDDRAAPLRMVFASRAITDKSAPTIGARSVIPGPRYDALREARSTA